MVKKEGYVMVLEERGVIVVEKRGRWLWRKGRGVDDGGVMVE